MASTTSMTAWTEELAVSLVPQDINYDDFRKIKNAFGKRLKHHTYGRTNQFEVEEKLDGLEEKWQILNHDELSDALHTRRSELKNYDQPWLPDVLDLLLRLSKGPSDDSPLDSLSKIDLRPQSPPPLLWADIEMDDPIDRSNPIWALPQYEEFSSDDDQSPSKIPGRFAREKGDINAQGQNLTDTLLKNSLPIRSINPVLLASVQTGQFWRKSSANVELTELQAIREVLSMLQGYPTFLFTASDSNPNLRFCISHISFEAFQSEMTSLKQVGARASLIRKGITVSQNIPYIQMMRKCIEEVAHKFTQFISNLEHETIEKSERGGVVSLISTHQQIDEAARPLSVLENLFVKLEGKDAVGRLEAFFDGITEAELRNDLLAFGLLMPMFLSIFKVYMRPVISWMQHGQLDSELERFFVVRNEQPSNKSSLWHDWYILQQSGIHRVPSFLKKFAVRIFVVGKTAAFLDVLDDSHSSRFQMAEDLNFGMEGIYEPTESSLVPFDAAFESFMDAYAKNILHSTSGQLRFVLENDCGLRAALDALCTIYLAGNGIILDNVDSKLFYRIDRCNETWNDRFLVADLLTEEYSHLDFIDPQRIIVQSEYTSSRGMEHRRRSVKTLESLSIHYVLPWPIANILLPDSLTSYRKVSLLLNQIRRAKYTLERTAHFYVYNVIIEGDATGGKLSQGLHSSLLSFVNTLYDHLTSCVVGPMTSNMRSNLTGTVDKMVEVHNTYVQALEHACLSSTNLKMIRDAIIVILDLCIRFSDLVSMPTNNIRRSSADFETNSFVSARSRRQKRLADDDDSSEDDRDYEEGYSTFVLEDDTTTIEELRKIKSQQAKHISFLVAGLRGASRTSNESAELLELLADRLEVTFQKKTNAFY